MKTAGKCEARGGWRRIALLMAMLVAVLTCIPELATAGHRDRRERDDERRRVVHRDVPRRLHYKARREYRPYYAGRIYHRAHHHYHRAYHFPVLVHGVVVHRPFYYCGDHIFLRAGIALPQLVIGVDFGAPGVVYGPNYPPPPPHYKHHDHDDCEDDDEYEYEEDDD